MYNSHNLDRRFGTWKDFDDAPKRWREGENVV